MIMQIKLPFILIYQTLRNSPVMVIYWIGLIYNYFCFVSPGLSCPEAGYMTPDASNLCFVWFCEFAGEAPIKRMCPKGVRVPSWWEGGRLNMCNIVNILKHGGEPTCLRCAADDIRPQDSKSPTFSKAGNKLNFFVLFFNESDDEDQDYRMETSVDQ